MRRFAGECRFRTRLGAAARARHRPGRCREGGRGDPEGGCQTPGKEGAGMPWRGKRSFCGPGIELICKLTSLAKARKE